MATATLAPAAMFVLSWAETAIDDAPRPPRRALRAGARWSWTGAARRIDLSPDLSTDAMTPLRHRAAARARQWLNPGAAWRAADQDRPDDGDLTVTDGHQSWTLSLIPAGPGRDDLLIITGALPPANIDLYIVRTEAAPLPKPNPTGMICFTPGTMILTAQGPVAVETLRPGDRIQTKDDGPAEILWIGRHHITGARLHAQPHLTPIRLRAGALGLGVSDDGLLVSPDHRLVLQGARARALFNQDEVLVAARDLTFGTRISPEPGLRSVTYLHILLGRHAVIFANGVETDSFHPAAADLTSLDDPQRAALLVQFPDVAHDPHSYGPFARRALTPSETAILRHDLPRAA